MLCTLVLVVKNHERRDKPCLDLSNYAKIRNIDDLEAMTEGQLGKSLRLLLRILESVQQTSPSNHYDKSLTFLCFHV